MGKKGSEFISSELPFNEIKWAMRPREKGCYTLGEILTGFYNSNRMYVGPYIPRVELLFLFQEGSKGKF